jgi:1-phosphofructokinase family hexose kinase
VILSAGLTPAWQQILVFDRFQYGEVNRAGEVAWCASGKVFNAGIAAHHLGGPSLTLAAVGGPPLPQLERELDQMGVPRHWVVTKSATRICTTIIDRASGVVTELVENGRPLSTRELEQFRTAYVLKAAAADVVMILGSLPVGTPVSFYRDLLEQTHCPAVLDFRGEGLLGVLDLKPYVVKPNRQELAQTVGHPLENDAQLLDAMRTLNDRGAEWVVTTQGAGPIWVSSRLKRYRVMPLRAGEVVNPIGCGDALAAAIAWATRQGYGLVEAVRWGVAAAAENLGQLLPGRLDAQRVCRRAAEVQVQEVA